MTSRLCWNSPSTLAPGAGTRRRPTPPAGRSGPGRHRTPATPSDRPARLVWITRYWPAGNAQRLVSSRLRSALDVEVPFAQIAVEAQRLNRECESRRSSHWPGGPRPPPNPSQSSFSSSSPPTRAVVPGAAGIDGKRIARSPIARRTQHDPDVILRLQVRVARDAAADDARGIVLEDDADDENIGVGDDPDDGPDARRLAFPRIGLEKPVRASAPASRAHRGRRRSAAKP